MMMMMMMMMCGMPLGVSGHLLVSFRTSIYGVRSELPFISIITYTVDVIVITNGHSFVFDFVCLQWSEGLLCKSDKPYNYYYRYYI